VIEFDAGFRVIRLEEGNRSHDGGREPAKEAMTATWSGVGTASRDMSAMTEALTTLFRNFSMLPSSYPSSPGVLVATPGRGSSCRLLPCG
jgi:hypothetical protein